MHSLVKSAVGFGLLCASVSTQGIPDSCLEFDGVDDFVNVPFHPALTVGPGGQFTIECWFRSAVAYQTHLVARAAGNGSPGPFLLDINHPAVGDVTLFTYPGLSEPSSATGVNINDGLWHHVAAAYDASGVPPTVAMFVDGAAVATNSLSGETTDGGYALTVGQHQLMLPNEFFAGRIDEVRYWNVARTAAEIGANWNTALTGFEPGLVGYWRLNFGSGQFVFDSAFSPSLIGTLGATSSAGADDPSWKVAGTFSILFTGCPAASPLTLSIDSPPLVGGTVHVTAGNVPAGTTIMVFSVGFGIASLPLAPFPCDLHVASIAGNFILFPPPGPAVTLSYQVPPQPAITSLILSWQAFGLHGAGPSLVGSPLGRMQVGSR